MSRRQRYVTTIMMVVLLFNLITLNYYVFVPLLLTMAGSIALTMVSVYAALALGQAYGK